MIRYADALDEIDTAMRIISPDWRTRAIERTDLFERIGRYCERYVDPATGLEQSLDPFWGELKSVFMRRQYNKCAYCETKLEGGSFASVAWDVEHFRPKSQVSAWKPKPRIAHSTDYSFPLGNPSQVGYFLLSYQVLNYAVACKICNTTFKGNYFPVIRSRVLTARHPSDCIGEQTYLPYPLGTSDEDPEDLIRFEGAEALPRYSEHRTLCNIGVPVWPLICSA